MLWLTIYTIPFFLWFSYYQMATNRLLGLPPVTPELKSINPYLQRADELKSQDPIMAYWCAYYAAQVGISLKAKSNPSRDVLFSLLGVLEHLKKDIGPNDAIDMEAASSAYVENFALRVFTMADNEDRSGGANRFVSSSIAWPCSMNASHRSTAKKFLAAANFLEVLKTFPKSEVSDSVLVFYFTAHSWILNHLLRTKKRFDTRNGKQQILPNHFVKAESLLPVQRANHKNLLLHHQLPHHHQQTTFDMLHLPKSNAPPHLLISIFHVQVHHPTSRSHKHLRVLAQSTQVSTRSLTYILADGEERAKQHLAAGVQLQRRVQGNLPSNGNKHRRHELQMGSQEWGARIVPEAVEVAVY